MADINLIGPVQLRIVEIIAECSRRGYAPSVIEVAGSMKREVNQTRYSIQGLVKRRILEPTGDKLGNHARFVLSKQSQLAYSLYRAFCDLTEERKEQG